MTWGDIPPLSTKTIRFPEGDLCVLAVNAHGLQVDDANLYCTMDLRPTNMALKTMRACMDAICHLYNWGGSAAVDVKARIETGEFFTRDEVAALRADLRRDLRKSSTQRRRQSKSVSKHPGCKKAQTVVDNGHWRNRCVSIRDYVGWLAEEVIGRMSVRDERLAEYRRRLDSFKEKIVGDICIRKSGPLREGLSWEAQKAFLYAITLGHPTNPFPVRHQIRNHALWLTYYHGGIRLPEVLGLKGVDLVLNGPEKKIVVHRRPDDRDDTRANAPLTKTLPHNVIPNESLQDALYTYVVKARPGYRGAKRSPFVFMSQKGKPLSKEAVAHMYRKLQKAVPELKGFSTPLLRYTWNDRFGAAAKELGMSETEEKSVRNSAQGWTPDSNQGQNYQNRRNRERAAEISLTMQDAATGNGDSQ